MLDGLLGQVQFGADLLVAQTARYQLQDLMLSFGQLLEPRQRTPRPQGLLAPATRPRPGPLISRSRLAASAGVT